MTGYTPPGVESPVPFRTSARPPGGEGGHRLGLRLFAGSILAAMCAAAWLPPQAERVADGEDYGRLRVLPSAL